MRNRSLFDRCRINTNIENDVFVGIQRRDDTYEVHFPLGYRCSADEKGLRRDILSLLHVLAWNTDKRESEIDAGRSRDDLLGIPVQAYLYLIRDFFERGYYKERDTCRQVAKRGKVDWGRTVRTQKPLIRDNEACYLDFIVKRNARKTN